MIFFDKTRTIGQDANGKNVVWASIYVDTAANLPAYNAYQTDGFMLCMASEGRCIDTGDLYRLDSAGTWQIAQAGTGTYTRSEIDTLLAAKQNVLAFDATPTQDSTNPVTSGGIWTDQQRQETEIGVVANAGAKNFLDVQHPTSTTRTSYTPLANGGVELSCSNATWTSYAIANIPVEVGKEYAITFLLDESSGTSNFYFFLRNGDSSGTNLATKNYGSTTGNYEASFTPSNSVIWLGIYLNNSATAATATAKLRCMIRPAAITDQTFQPYAPTNRELYEMILALQ